MTAILQMLHPDRVVTAEGLAKLPLIDPVYPLTEGLHPINVRKALDGALERLPTLPEWQDAAWLARNRFPSFAEALHSIHRPQSPADLEPDGLAWSRLAYDELLAGQLALALLRAHMRKRRRSRQRRRRTSAPAHRRGAALFAYAVARACGHGHRG